MGITKVNALHTAQTRAKLLTSLPSAPSTYYGSAVNDVDSAVWRGGEMIYHTGENRYYIQTATSGTTATWVRLLQQAT